MRACREVVPLDTAALSLRTAALTKAASLRPGVFLLYHDCLAAARRDDPDGLAALLRALATICLMAPPLAVRNFGDPSLPAEEWDRYRRALLAEPDAAVAIGPAEPAAFVAATELLASARTAIAVADPALAEEIAALINEIVFARELPGSSTRFGGATSFAAWGATFLNVGGHRSMVAMANALVHEAAHALLFGLSCGNPLVDNDVNDRYASPLRADRRPMEGIFHATFVSARMCYAMTRLLGSGTLDGPQRQQAGAARDDAVRAFNAGYATVQAHARPTPVGRAAMQAAASYMQGAPDAA
jgi:HEXXH motif-containing protein